MNSERLALFIVILIVLGLPAAAFGYQHIRTASAGMRVIDLNARLPEEGGWSPEVLRITAGSPCGCESTARMCCIVLPSAGPRSAPSTSSRAK